MELNKLILKGAMKMITPDQIQDAIHGITEFAIKEKDNYPLDTARGESNHSIMIYDVDGVLFFSIGIIIDAEPMMISRFVGTRPLSEMILSITKQF
jgi:hypothetical protein